MTELASDAFRWVAGALLSVLSFFGVSMVRKVDALQKEKADRSEVTALLERIDKSNEEARTSRKELHQKIDGYMSSQAEINREVAGYIGRMSGGQ